MYKVTVIIPTYNLSNYIKESIDSALAQTYRHCEIIIIDDGSTDNKRDVLAQYIKNNLIKYIYQENKGISGARNAGIKNAKGDFIAFLDADDLWVPNKLEIQIRAFREHPDIGLVHSDIYLADAKSNIICQGRKNFNNKSINLHSGYIFNDFFLRNIFISCLTVMVKKECFEKVGLFDESPLLMGFDDSEMWLRILHQYGAYYIHEPLAIYRYRDDSFSKKNRTKMIQAHKTTIEKLAKQYNLPAMLKKKAINRMKREWELGIYALLRYMKEKAKIIKSQFVKS